MLACFPRVLAFCVAALLALLIHPAEAQAPATDALWRHLFQRPNSIPEPPDNRLTPENVALGAALFADPRLSGTGTHSCASCHEPARSFTDGRQRARALSGKPLRRNTPSLWNLAWAKQFFWDGRAPSLEVQVRGPIEAADEMGGRWPDILRRLERDGGLVARFHAAYPDGQGVTEDNIVKALAAYVRSLVSPQTRFDAWIAGDANVLTPAEQRGFRIFTGQAGCMLCHVGWRFTDDKFHDIGLRSRDPGRSAVPNGTPGRMAFKTPSLRQLVHTAPYMHDGSLPTLQAVVAHYAGRFVRRATLAPNMNRHLRLTAQEKADLVSFLRTLSSEKAALGSKPGAASH
jgi:cytochrome c peroxidase